jgi:hypothetical protein
MTAPLPVGLARVKYIDSHPNFMSGRILLAVLVSISFILTALAGAVDANLAAEPTGGIAAEGNRATFLRTADVLIEMKDETATGAGRYMLFNPSNVTEFLTICFDSGTISSNVTVNKNGFRVVAEPGAITSHLRNYWGTVFEVAVGPGTHANITVDWEFDIIERGGTQYTDRTSYVARYLIIGTAGWNHSIDRVNVTFRLNSSHFRSYSANSGFKAYTMDGAAALTYEFTEFDLQEEEIVVRGDSFIWNIGAMSCIILFIVAGIVGVALYLWIRKREKGD